MRNYTANELKRLWQKVDKRGPDDCWPWLAYRQQSGHGRLNIKNGTRFVHRIIYELTYGAIPDGLVVRHKCNFAPCCNPAHLELGTPRDNVQDMIKNTEPIKKEDHPLPGERPWAKFNGRKSTPSERFWNKVDKSTECWLWTGALRNGGYGMFPKNGKSYLAHRFAWELEYGEIPEGMIILHTCDTPRCVRVSHLKLGTHAENSADMVQKGRHEQRRGKDSPTYGRLHTHCKKGHELTGDNVVLTHQGKIRHCLICYRAYNLAYSEKQKALRAKRK